VIVATDAHALIMYPIEITENDFNLDGLIVPIRFFNHLKYMADIAKADFDLLDYILTDEYAEVYFCGEMVFRCKYIDGKYPKFEKIIPKDTEKEDFNEWNKTQEENKKQKFGMKQAVLVAIIMICGQVLVALLK